MHKKAKAKIALELMGKVSVIEENYCFNQFKCSVAFSHLNQIHVFFISITFINIFRLRDTIKK